MQLLLLALLIAQLLGTLASVAYVLSVTRALSRDTALLTDTARQSIAVIEQDRQALLSRSLHFDHEMHRLFSNLDSSAIEFVAEIRNISRDSIAELSATSIKAITEIQRPRPPQGPVK